MQARPGDHVFFQTDDGPTHGEVKAVGKHGCTVFCPEKKRHSVRWNKLLGHKQRAHPNYKMIEQGEDGSLIEDEHGKRRFITGPLPDSNKDSAKGQHTLIKALSGTRPDEHRLTSSLSGTTPLLLDLGPLSCDCTDHTLEALYKGLAEPTADSLWVPHHDPFIRDHLEEVTARGLAILKKIQQAMECVVDTSQNLFAESKEGLAKAFTWPQVDNQQLDAIKEHLAKKNPNSYTLDDWLLAVDWIAGTYLPPGVIRSEAEFLTVRAQIIGKLQANLEKPPPDPKLHALIGRLPVSVGTMPFNLPQREQAVLTFARARGAELISDILERTRHRMRQVLLDHEYKKILKEPEASLWHVQSKLSDEFAILNRDWRRIAVTEVARTANEGFVSSLPDGSKVKRLEAYAGACPFCQALNGKVFHVVSPATHDRDGYHQVWVGKTNVHRSASPRKRVGGELVPREDHEMWWPSAGVQHPNCRGTWQRVGKRKDSMDPEFSAWVKEQLAAVKG